MPHAIGSNFGKRFDETTAARHQAAKQAEDEELKAECRQRMPADKVAGILEAFRKLKREQGDGNGQVQDR